MRVLLVDTAGVGLSLALRGTEAGHEVRWFVKSNADIGAGFSGVVRVDNWVAHAAWADIIVCTGGDYLSKLDWFRERGYPVFGPTKESARLEISVKDGIQLLEKVGMSCAPYQTFPTTQAAERHVLRTGERFLFRSLVDSSVSYTPRSAADLVAWMRRTPTPLGEVMLQACIEGTKIGSARFMGSSGWVGPWNEYFDCASGNGSVSYFTDVSKVGRECLDRLRDPFMQLGHTGALSVIGTVDETGKLWADSIKCGLNWPATHITLGAIKGDPITWMRDAIGDKDTTAFSEDIGACTVMSHSGSDEVPVYGITRGTAIHTQPRAIKKATMPDMTADGKVKERDMWVTAGKTIAVITGYGKDVKQATRRIYSTVDKLYAAGASAHRGVGDDLKHSLPKLHAFGYALHCTYA